MSSMSSFLSFSIILFFSSHYSFPSSNHCAAEDDSDQYSLSDKHLEDDPEGEDGYTCYDSQKITCSFIHIQNLFSQKYVQYMRTPNFYKPCKYRSLAQAIFIFAETM